MNSLTASMFPNASNISYNKNVGFTVEKKFRMPMYALINVKKYKVYFHF